MFDCELNDDSLAFVRELVKISGEGIELGVLTRLYTCVTNSNESTAGADASVEASYNVASYAGL